jgi:UDP-N-acetylmuramoyl-tripeptide--D-alanyl-D-alanine ligase
MFKAYIQRKLEHYVKKYLRNHSDIKLVAVAGSVGKTTTKIAIGTVLSKQFTIRLHEGNHNSEISAPLSILGIEYPDNIRSVSQWRKVFKAARMRIKFPSDVNVIIQEVGTDRIGDVPHFGTYVTPDIAVVTAVSPEHMEFFGTIEAVAAEELSIVNYSKLGIINRDDIDGGFAELITNPQIDTYGTSVAAEYSVVANDMTLEGSRGALMTTPEWGEQSVELHVLGEQGARAAAAAAAVGIKLGMTSDNVAAGLSAIRAVSGRMNILRGVEGSTIIDDTYNSSPLAAAASLRVLYQLQAPQKIAVLGSMNELGAITAEAHDVLGSLCDPSQLSYIVTVGDDAATYLAPAAKRNGCQVMSFKSALEAGAFVHKVMEEQSIVLFKGSQGGIYLEEAIKIVLHSTEEESQLVRQSEQWMAKKRAFFDSLSTVQPEA